MYLITNNIVIPEKGFAEHKFPSFNLYFKENAPDVIRIQSDAIFIYRGYFAPASNCPNSEGRLIELINAGQWPLPENWTGSFSFIYYSFENKTISIGTDSIGIYPCYYYCNNGLFAFSDNLILISAAIKDFEIDEAGVFQRMIYEYSNFGNRSIIENVKSLLPGEFITFKDSGEKILSKFDNSLFGPPLYNDLAPATIAAVYNNLKTEYTYATNRFRKCFIALSGGLDSRLVLGLTDPDKVEACLTYGADDFYETKIARKLAKAYGYKSFNYYSSEDQWPTRTDLIRIVKGTESMSVAQWMPILKNIEMDFGKCILLGDMCESLPGRNIKQHSSRKSRIDRFKSSLVFNKPVTFTPVSENSFISWEELKLKRMRDLMLNSEVFESVFKENLTVVEESIKDLRITTGLIKNHDIRFSELYDEAFEWFLHGRLPMGKQVTIFSEYFEGLAPSMGLLAIRTVSKIHPSLRLDYHFMSQLIHQTGVFKVTLKVPTAQSPFVPYSFPNAVKLFVWGLRSRFDNYFIRRMVNKKDYSLRYRLLKSINFPALYHEPDAINRISSYFNDGSYRIKEICLGKANNRKNLVEWPLSNFDIINLAALYTQIDLIKTNKKGNTSVENKSVKII